MPYFTAVYDVIVFPLNKTVFKFYFGWWFMEMKNNWPFRLIIDVSHLI